MIDDFCSRSPLWRLESYVVYTTRSEKELGYKRPSLNLPWLHGSAGQHLALDISRVCGMRGVSGPGLTTVIIGWAGVKRLVRNSGGGEYCGK